MTAPAVHAGDERTPASPWPLEADLRYALTRGELVVYYQPQIDVTTSRIIGMEALVRWQHPERGMVYPTISFLGRGNGLDRLGEWVLRPLAPKQGVSGRRSSEGTSGGQSLSANSRTKA